MSIAIYIPSHRRVGRQRTFEGIPRQLQKRTYIVVDKKDYKPYRKKYGSNVIECPKRGICSTRQWILENSIEKYALMIDDDMSFNVREGGLVRKCSKLDFIKMIILLESWLKQGFIHVGISHRFGNNRVTEDYLEVGRMNNTYAYNCEKMIELKDGYEIAFDGLEKKYNKRLVMEDFYLTLSLLQLGYPNKITYKYMWSQEKSGAEGGCSLYRTPDMQKRSAELLAKEFPGLVKVVEKESKEKWGGFDSNVRTDVIIYWKKCFDLRKREKGIGDLL